MREVLLAFPGAQRALFQRYHIGGCHSCGYHPDDSLEAVASKHGIGDLDGMLLHIRRSHEVEKQLQIGPRETAEALRSESPPRLIDVRTPEEWDLVRLDGAVLFDQALGREMKEWPKDTPIVLYCHVGDRSLDAASYFVGHGFRNARSLAGGIDRWSLEVDPKVQRYSVAPRASVGIQLRPLRSSVSQVEGCPG
jgi:rhodanese-related sulfurtransferase